MILKGTYPFCFLLLAGWDADIMAGAEAAILDSGFEAMFQEDSVGMDRLYYGRRILLYLETVRM